MYIVTAVQEDPLWIVDNTDPAAPTLSGELHVPGFSSYIEPLGDRLVTVGRLRTDDGQNRVTVSLYDVADATKPVQLSQLPIGTNWSHSEAEWNDKAFTVLPEAGLIMLPYSEGWRWWGSTGAGGVQLVDLNRDGLALRGVIRHGFVPRRTAVKDDTVLALSASDLLTVDIADRDVPVVKADVELAWNVSRVWVAGKHLLQLGQHLSDRKPVLSVSTQENTDDTLSTLDLEGGTVQAAELKGDLLYVVQSTTVATDNATFQLRPYYYGNSSAGPLKLSVFHRIAPADRETRHRHSYGRRVLRKYLTPFPHGYDRSRRAKERLLRRLVRRRCGFCHWNAAHDFGGQLSLHASHCGAHDGSHRWHRDSHRRILIAPLLGRKLILALSPRFRCRESPQPAVSQHHQS